MIDHKSFWVVMPAWLALDKSIPREVKDLYAIISALASKEGFCWASNAYLAKELGVASRTVIRNIIKLEELGVVNAERGQNTRKIYMGSVIRVTGGSDKLKPSVSLGSDSHKPDVSPNIVYTKTISTPPSEEVGDVEIIPDEDTVPTRTLKRKALVKAKGYDPADTTGLLEWQEERMGRKYPNPLVQMAAIATMLAAKYTPKEIQESFQELEGTPFWEEKGVDFKVLAGQIAKMSRKNNTTDLWDK